MDALLPYLAQIAPSVVVPIVAVVIAFKALMNGMRDDVAATRAAVERLDAKLDGHSERIVRLEALTMPPAVRPVLREIANGD